VEIVGIQSGKDPLRFTLPFWNFETKLQFSGEQQSVSMRLETVIIQTEKKQLNLIWAAHNSCDKKVLKIKEILVEGGILPFST
jgi:hypothetical protein